MDADTQDELKGRRLLVPRFLFRGWRAASGGDARLNTPTRITPPRFLHRPLTNVYDMSNFDMASMVDGHTSGRLIPSGFSSWTPWFSLAEGFCHDDETAHISVIDTTILFDTNPVFHVPDLSVLVPSNSQGRHIWASRVSSLHCEYLAWGIIEGPFLRAAPHKVFKEALFGIPRSLSVVITHQQVDGYNHGSGIKHHSIRKTIYITNDLVMKIRGVGLLYGDHFAMPIILQNLARLMPMRPRSVTESDNLELARIIKNAVAGLQIPCDWHDQLKSCPPWSEVLQFYLLWSRFAQTPINYSPHDFERDKKIRKYYEDEMLRHLAREKKAADPEELGTGLWTTASQSDTALPTGALNTEAARYASYLERLARPGTISRTSTNGSVHPRFRRLTS